MPSLIDIRRRIRAVKSTQQITKAMKMIAASKLRRAQERIISARPFAREMQRVLGGLVARVDSSMHPLLADHDPATATGRTLLLIVTADKGLCGGFNTNIIKAASGAIREAGGPVVLGLIGRKGREFFGRRGFEVVHEDVGIFSAVKYPHAQGIAAMAIEQFTSKRVDRVVVVYNEFKSVMQQRINVEQLLPIPRAEVAATEVSTEAAVDYLYEPPAQQIFETLLPRHVEIQIYRVLLESAAAEHAARMTAMEAATKNSTEMIDNLTLYMNKVRQAAITREIIEVVSGAQAL